MNWIILLHRSTSEGKQFDFSVFDVLSFCVCACICLCNIYMELSIHLRLLLAVLYEIKSHCSGLRTNVQIKYSLILVLLQVTLDT